MKTKYTVLLSFVVMLLLLLPKSLRADDDWQYWSEYNFSYKLTDRLSVILNPSIRIKDNVSENQYWESRQGVSYKLTDQLAFNLHYLHSETKSITNKWTDENTFEAQPTYKWKWGGFDLANRFRLEYRIVNGAEKWRYRDQIKAGRKVKIWEQEITPFISNEFFYDESVDQMNQNRARAGIAKKVSSMATVSVFYQYKSNRVRKDWYGENILGSGLDLSF